MISGSHANMPSAFSVLKKASFLNPSTIAWWKEQKLTSLLPHQRSVVVVTQSEHGFCKRKLEICAIKKNIKVGTVKFQLCSS